MGIDAGAAGFFGRTTGRMEQRAGEAESDTTASGLYDYATSGERADTSIQCTGLGAIYLLQPPRHGPGIYYLMWQRFFLM